MRVCVAAALSVLIGALSVQGVSAQTLNEALTAAVEYSPTLRTQRAALKSLDENVAVARSGKRPIITGSVSQGLAVSESSEGLDDSAQETFPSQLSLTGRQTIYDGGQTENAVDSALKAVESGRLTLLDVEQAVLLGAVEAYVDVITAQENVRLEQNNVAVIAEALQAARDRFEVGEVTRTDVAQAEARLAEARADLQTARGVLGQARQSYIREIGVTPGALDPLPPLPQVPQNFDEARAIAERNHPSILAARANVEAASFSVREAQGALLPQVDVSASGATGADTINRGSGTFNLQATLEATVPLYQGGVLRSDIRRAQALASQRRFELLDTTRDIIEQAGVAWENLQTSRATIRSNQEQVRAQRVAFEGVEEEAKVGARTTLDVLDARQEVLDAETDLVASRSTLYLNAYALLSAIGVLTIAKLDLPTDVYDPVPAFQSAQGFDAGYPETEDTQWLHNWRP